MYKTQEKLEEIKLVGLTARTSYISEMDSNTAKIGSIVKRFYDAHMSSRIRNKKSDRVFAVYTDYESDEHGPYTYFLGCEVTSFNDVEDEFETITIPVQNYIKFTSSAGKMPDICIDMWKNIWKMNAEDLGGARSYIADFEIYDERSIDPNNTILDIYIGI